VTAANRPALLELHGNSLRSLDAGGAHGCAQGRGVAPRLKPPQIMMALRLLVAGTTSTPAIDAVTGVAAVGDVTRKRMAEGLGI
jgi:hypothetical protein